MKGPSRKHGLGVCALGIALGGWAVSACPPTRNGQSSPSYGASGPESGAASPPTTPSGAPVRQLALLVGINDYKYQDIGDLRGCLNDVANMRDLLTKRYGFKDSDVKVLTDHQATQKGIVDAFRSHLVERVKSQDTVALFYYSGHGSQMGDVSGDEPDGWDETLVTYDSGRLGDHENRDLSDDTLNLLVGELNQKTKNVVVMLDSCHSGTAVRASGRRRWVAPDPRIPRGTVAARGQDDAAGGFHAEGSEYVLISGSRSDEFSYERSIDGLHTGAMTWFLTDELRGAGPQDTYRDIMERVTTRVSTAYPEQHPQLEGSRMDTEVFGIKQLAPSPFIEVRLVDGKLQLSAGLVHGLHQGSQFAVYPPKEKAFEASHRIATVELVKVNATTAIANIIGSAATIPDHARAVETLHASPQAQLRVAYLNRASSKLLGQVREQLRHYPLIAEADPEETYDVLLREDDTGRVITEGGTPTEISSPVAPGPKAVDEVARNVLGWAKWFNLEKIQNRRASLPVSVRLEGTTADNGTSEASPVSIRAGQEAEIVIENRAKTKLYISLLDLSGDGSVARVYPQRAGALEFVERGDTWSRKIRPCIPRGWHGPLRDIVKVFITETPTNLAFVEQAPLKVGQDRAVVRSAGQDDLARLIADYSLGPKTRGMEAPRVPADGWMTWQRALLIHPSDAPPCGG